MILSSSRCRQYIILRQKLAVLLLIQLVVIVAMQLLQYGDTTCNVVNVAVVVDAYSTLLPMVVIHPSRSSTYVIRRHCITPSFIRTTNNNHGIINGNYYCDKQYHHRHRNQQLEITRLYAAPKQPRNSSGKSGGSSRGKSSSSSSSSFGSGSSSNANKKKRDGPSTQTPRANTMRRREGTGSSSSDGTTMGGALFPTTSTLTMPQNGRPKSSSSSSKTMPPWNVRSPKDAIENVAAEKIRRAKIQQLNQQNQTNRTDNGGSQSQPTTTTTIPSNASSTTVTDTTTTTSQPPLLLSKVFLSNKEQQFIKWKRFKVDKRGGGSNSGVVVGQRLLHTFYNVSSLQQHIQPNYGVPEIAFIGRSNVGKSSLLNELSSSVTTSSSSSSSSSTTTTTMSTNTMARVGKTPGATASVNMYSLYNKKGKDVIIFTDLPGFGYAKLSKDRQEAIIRTTEQYIYQRSTITKTLALGILLLDIRRVPSDDDVELLETLYDMNVPILVVVTKCDKVSSKYEREQLLNTIQLELQLPQLPFTISSKTGENINALWQIILDAGDTCIQQLKQIYETVEDTTNDNDDDDDDEYNDTTAKEQQNSWYDDQEDEIDLANFDDDDIEYDQGFDWKNDNVMLEYDESNDDSDTNNINDDNRWMDDDDDEDDVENTEQESPPKRVATLKSLKRRVKKMQRRGEI